MKVRGRGRGRGQTEDRWPSFTKRKNPPICVLAVARRLPVRANARSLTRTFEGEDGAARQQAGPALGSWSFHYLGQQGVSTGLVIHVM